MSNFRTACPYCTDGKQYTIISRNHLKLRHDKTIWDLAKDFPDFPKQFYLTNSRVCFNTMTDQEKDAKQYFYDRLGGIDSAKRGDHCRFNETANEMSAKIRRN